MGTEIMTCELSQRVLETLRKGPASAVQIADALKSTPASVRRRITTLRQANHSIHTTAEGGDIYYFLAGDDSVASAVVKPESVETLKSLLSGGEFMVADICKETGWEPEFTYKAIETLKSNQIPVQQVQMGTHNFYTIPQIMTPVAAKTRVKDDDDEFMIGIVSDTHLGSNQEMMGELEDAYDDFASRGIKQVVHTGDIVDGVRVYSGQALNLKYKSMGGQITHLLRDYPSRKGITTHLVLGNHDTSFARQKVNFYERLKVELAKSKRNDIKPFGIYAARLEVGPLRIDGLHPDAGMSSTVAGKAEMMFRRMYTGQTSDLPHIFGVGHYHVSHNINMGPNTEALYTGTFQSQTAFMRRLGLIPHHAYYIVEVGLDGDRMVRWRPEKRLHCLDDAKRQLGVC